MLRYVAVALVAILATLGALYTLTQPAAAAVMPASSCRLAADDTGILYDLRTQGLTWDDAAPTVAKTLNEALRTKDTYVQSEDDRDWVYEMAEFAFKTNQNKERAMLHTFLACLSRAGVEPDHVL